MLGVKSLPKDFKTRDPFSLWITGIPSKGLWFNSVCPKVTALIFASSVICMPQLNIGCIPDLWTDAGGKQPCFQPKESTICSTKPQSLGVPEGSTSDNTVTLGLKVSRDREIKEKEWASYRKEGETPVCISTYELYLQSPPLLTCNPVQQTYKELITEKYCPKWHGCYITLNQTWTLSILRGIL